MDRSYFGTESTLYTSTRAAFMAYRARGVDFRLMRHRPGTGLGLIISSVSCPKTHSHLGTILSEGTVPALGVKLLLTNWSRHLSLTVPELEHGGDLELDELSIEIHVVVMKVL
jgi:hypothetical protein